MVFLDRREPILSSTALGISSAARWRLVRLSPAHSLVPSFGGSDGVMLAAAIVGATVMPHAVFLHSSVARDRLPAADLSTLRRLVRASNTDVAFTLGAVGLVNMAIMCVAAVTCGAGGSTGDASIEDRANTRDASGLAVRWPERPRGGRAAL
jgi:Mn2+/Fe2+ NRAMP family transporter